MTFVESCTSCDSGPLWGRVWIHIRKQIATDGKVWPLGAWWFGGWWLGAWWLGALSFVDGLALSNTGFCNTAG